MNNFLLENDVVIGVFNYKHESFNYSENCNPMVLGMTYRESDDSFFYTKEQLAGFELNWRNGELDFIDSKSYAADFPYLSEIQTYKQELRDYDYNEGLTENRPSRPVTVKGSQIITGDK